MSQKRSFRRRHQGCQLGSDARKPEEQPEKHSPEHEALVAQILANAENRGQGRTNVTRVRQLEAAGAKR